MPTESSDEALVLRMTPWGERDAIVHLLTRESGRIGVFVRGLRGSRKRFAGGLQRFALLRVEVRSRRSGLPTLTGSELLHVWIRLGEELERLAAASVVLEILGRVLPEEEPDPALFARLLRYLTWLDEGQRSAAQTELGLFRMLMVLLEREGLWPEIGVCVRTGVQLASHEEVWWVPDQGPVLRKLASGEAGWPLSAEAWSAITLLAAGQFPPPLSAPAMGCLHALLRGLWERLLERRIEAWDLLVQGR